MGLFMLVRVMKKLLVLLALTVWLSNSFAARAWALAPFQPLAPQTLLAAGSQPLTGLYLETYNVSWQTTTTARYVMVFDATSLPGNGATTACTTSHVAGCLLWCRYAVNSGSAPQNDWAVWGDAPLAAKFGLVIALSTGAGCGTLTVDGANDNWTSQAY